MHVPYVLLSLTIQVVKLELGDGGSCLGVLQPVTSLVSTLSMLKPHHHQQLLKRLVNPPLGTEGAKVLSVPLSSSSRKQLPIKKVKVGKLRVTSEVVEQTPSLGPQTDLRETECIYDPLPGSLPGNAEKCLSGEIPCNYGGRSEESKTSKETALKQDKEDDFIVSCASDCELYTGLQLLFRKKPERGTYMYVTN